MRIRQNFGPFFDEPTLERRPWSTAGELAYKNLNNHVLFRLQYSRFSKRTVLCTYHKNPLTCKLMTSLKFLFARWRHFTTTTHRILFVFTFKFGNPSEV